MIPAESTSVAEAAEKFKWQVRDTCTRAETAESQRDAALSQLAEARGENAWRPIDPNALPDPKRGPYLTTNSPDSRDAFGRPSHVWLVSMFHRTDGPEGPVAAFDRDGYTKIWDLELYAPIPSPPSEGN
jgi:hypothetical protein